PQITVVVVLVADAAAATFAALFFGLLPAMLLGLVTGLSQQLGKLSLDSIIQNEIPEEFRTSVFARSETLLQLSWVLGGFLGVFMPESSAKPGLFIVAALLIGWLVFVLRGLIAARESSRTTAH